MYTDVVKLGKKGQITLPKEIRDDEDYHEGDVFTINHIPGGDIILQKKSDKTPEEKLMDFLDTVPKFDVRKAWKEIEEERNRER